MSRPRIIKESVNTRIWDAMMALNNNNSRIVREKYKLKMLGIEMRTEFALAV